MLALSAACQFEGRCVLGLREERVIAFSIARALDQLTSMPNLPAVHVAINCSALGAIMRRRRWGGGGQEELVANRCPGGSLDVWQRGVDTEAFHPRRRTAAMRARLSANRPDSTVLIYVGRLGSGVGFFTPLSLFFQPLWKTIMTSL